VPESPLKVEIILKMANMFRFIPLFYGLSWNDMNFENSRVAGSNPARATSFSPFGGDVSVEETEEFTSSVDG
jgi:hypothetical protein